MSTETATSEKDQTATEKYATRTFMKYSSAEVAVDAPNETVLLNGNEALARGCIEAGVRVGTCYPGSPVTYTLDNLAEAAKVFPSMHVEWSVNEKAAYEVALGAAMTGVRAMCVFKNVGLDVALDAVVCSAVDLGPGGLVLIVCDDPGMGATQAEVDIRYLAKYSSIPVLEPSTMQDVKDFTAAAFALSEAVHLPVLVRPMYAQCYAREPVILGEIQHDIRERVPHYNVRDWHPPHEEVKATLHRGPTNWAHARFHSEVPPAARELTKGWPNLADVVRAVESFAGNQLTIKDGAKVGIISSGLAYRETMEALKVLGGKSEVSILKLATSYPLPEDLVRKLLKQTETVLVVEEIEPFIEEQVRSLSAEMDTHAKLLGKLTGDIPVSNELKRSQIGPVLGRLLGRKYEGYASAERIARGQEILQHLPVDPVVARQCPGCPGTAAAYALKNVARQLGLTPSMQFFGYDGCAGGVPIGEGGITLCMGGGINLAAGMHHAGLKGKQVVLCGDSNFFHAFMPGLVEAVYNKSDVLLYVMDNRTTAMTGHQPHPGGFGVTAEGEPTKTLDIAEIARACQADFVTVVDPYDQRETFAALKEALTTTGVSVVVSRRTCAVVAQRQKGAKDALIFDTTSQINRDKCLAWTVEMAPCEAKCPINQDVEGYVRAVAEGDFKKALAIVRETNPFPAVCGRVCNHLCETACKRGKIDEPIAIRSLKRFIADYELVNGVERPQRVPRTKQEKIAIIGAGPAGLTAGHDLVKLGYGVTVFEAAPVAGGMLTYGIPEFVLPQQVLQDEIGYIADLGVEIRTNTALGRDLSLADLRNQGYKAVFVAAGAQKGNQLRVPGEDLDGATVATDFLARVAKGEKVEVGRRVVVVGGGFTAIDAARTARRLGASEVSIVYRRSRSEMPASEKEITEAEREGVGFQFLAAPVGIIGEQGRVTGLACQRMKLGAPGPDGRRNPEPVDDSSFVLTTDMVINAVGQSPDVAAIAAASGVALTPQGTIVADNLTLATNQPGIFAGGDVIKGAGTVVESIAMGHEAAISIERYLKGQDLREGRVSQPPVTGANVLPEGMLTSARQQMPSLLENERIQSFAEVELGFSLDQAIAEAARCLKCKSCGRCIDEFACIAIVAEDGGPTMDLDICAGCNVCRVVCPYGNIEEVEVIA